MSVEHAQDHIGKRAQKRLDKTTFDASHQPLSLITFLLCIAAAVGISMTLLHILSQLFR
jgi:hypothetical protein